MADQDSIQETFYEFLDDLRDSGVTNMFGAAPYLQREFGLDRNKAKDVLLAWMKSDRHNN